MLEYKALYKIAGIRQRSDLLKPRLKGLNTFKFPKESIWHYLPNEKHENTIIPDISEIHDRDKHYLVNLVTRLAVEPTYARLRNTPQEEFYRIGRSQLADIPKTEKIDIDLYRRHPLNVKAKNDVIVEVYEPIEQSYIYRDLPLTNVYKWEDLSKTVVSNINNLASLSPRNHFIFVEVPAVRPRLAEFIKAQNYHDRVHLAPFVESKCLLLLDIFKWVGGKSDTLGALTDKALEKLTLVLHSGEGESAHYSLLNMGWLDHQIKRSETSERGSYAPEKAQKVLINIFNQIAVIPEVGLTEEPHALEEEIPTEIEDPTPTDTPDTSAEEELDADAVSDEELEEALVKGETISSTKAPKVNVLPDPIEAKPYQPKPKQLTDTIDATTLELVKAGVYSLPEAKKLQAEARTIDKLKNPLGEGTLKEFLHYDPKDLKIVNKPVIKDRDTIVDKGMLHCVTQEFNSRYIGEYYYKDVLNFATRIQNGGVIVKGIEVQHHESLMDNFYRFSMQVQPVPGKETTLSFDIPVPNEEGVYLSGGVNYFLKKQSSELPIRKVSPRRVALTSYMGKVFVDRKEAVKNNYGKWLLNKLTLIALDPKDNRITNSRTGNVFNRAVQVPKVYSTLASRFTSFTLNTKEHGALELSFDVTQLKVVNPELLELGVTKGGTSKVYIDGADQLWVGNSPIGTIEELLGFDSEGEKIHHDAVVVNVFGQKVGVGIFLAMEMGLSTLIKTLGCRFRRVDFGKSRKMSYNEYAITFKNESFIFDRRDKLATLILASFLDYKSSLSRYQSGLFDNKDIYILLLEESGLTARYYNEIDTIYKMFIDHVTEELLIEMNMPTDMGLLVLEAVKMLTYDAHPDEADTAFMRRKGYERMGGIVYNELVNSYRSMLATPNNKRRKIELHPMAVKMAIIGDSSQEIYQEINPIHALKQNEIMTLGGTGGRSFDALSMNIRGFHKNSLGTVSESSVDNKNAGAITYLSSNPKINSLRGTCDRYDPNVDKGVSSLLSTSAMLAPGSEHDDPKRIGYTSVQNSHVIPTVGYATLPVVTGQEQTIAEKMQNDIFAGKAKQDGIVVDVSRTIVRVKYKDDSIGAFEIGRRFGKSGGEIVPHSLVTTYKVGDTFKAGDILTYNEYYFEHDYILGLTYKGAVPVKVAFVNMAENYEDSNLVSPNFTKKFATKSSYDREIIVKFDQHIHNLVTVGQHVDTETPLCIIEEETTANIEGADPEFIKTLMNLGRNAPKARHMGVVEKIEIRYRGEKEDMNSTLQELAEYHDRAMIKHRTGLGLSKLNNQIKEAFRYGKTVVDNNHMVIIVKITEDVGAGTGDKGVLGNQMKFTIGKVAVSDITAEDGTDVDMIFGINPMNNRMVGHVTKIGTTNTLLEVIPRIALRMYRGETK